jgi:AcrR family transcriptional regulator
MVTKPTVLDSVKLENGTRRERRREELRERIFQAAIRLFMQQGFFNTTVEQITEAADVGKGTFFNYFDSKEHLVLKLTEAQEAVLRNLTSQLDSAGSVRALLKTTQHQIAAGPGRSQLMLRSLLGCAYTNDLVWERFKQLLALARELIAQVMRRGQELGEIRVDIPPLELARLYQQTVFGTNAIWSLHPPANLDEWIDRTFDIFWRGIAAEAQTVPRAARPLSSSS